MKETQTIVKEKLVLKSLPTEYEITKDLAIPEKQESIDPEIDKKTDQLVDELMGDKIDEPTKKQYINQMGIKYQNALMQHSKILDQSVRTLSRTQDGGNVAKDLLNLRNEVEKLNPRQYNLDSPAGAIAKFFRNIFGTKNPLSRYLEKYESAQHVINDIIDSLVSGKEQLKDDNTTLELDKKVMRDSLEGLMNAITIGEVLNRKIEGKLKSDVDSESELARFLQEEILFPLNQRIIDLQTTLAVNQQGVISYDLLIRNNAELITGVDRTVTITASALRIAVTTRLALNKQKQVLDAKKQIDQTTSDLITENARVLQTQGVEVQKQAAEATINVEKLTAAFDSLNQAMDEISNFRRESLPAMRNTVNKYKELTEKASQTIDRIEKGNQAQDNLIIDITSLE